MSPHFGARSSRQEMGMVARMGLGPFGDRPSEAARCSLCSVVWEGPSPFGRLSMTAGPCRRLDFVSSELPHACRGPASAWEVLLWEGLFAAWLVNDVTADCVGVPGYMLAASS